MKRYAVLALRKFVSGVFASMGWASKEATLAADVLISADLRGVHSHGLARLKGYVRLWDKGLIKPDAQARLLSDRTSAATIDADQGLGLVVAPRAMKHAIQKAKQSGIGYVCVQNSSHFGIAAYHSAIALKETFIGMAMTNASPLVAPTHSKERMLGTNPISIAIPAKNKPPFLLDMATTISANGKIERYKQTKKDIPLGWMLDKEGNPTSDPDAIKKGGTLLPIGGDSPYHSPYKGYGLAAWIDIFSGLLSGANYGPFVPPFVAYAEPNTKQVGKGIGHLFAAFDPGAFRPTDDFLTHMDHWITCFENAKPISKHHQVLIPGQPERAREKENHQKGIPIATDIQKDLEALGARFRVSFPSPIPKSKTAPLNKQPLI